MPAVADVDFPGTKRFAIERRLGAGGMGVVYQAYDRVLDTRVALKTLLHVDAEGLYRFKAEFRALADISHPNLVSLGELFAEDGRWFFTMELLEGQNFLSYVRTIASEGGPPPSADTLAMPPSRQVHPQVREPAEVAFACFDEGRLRASLAQLARGVFALHGAGKVHRDIKPSNIMVGPEGRVVILDFGLVADTRRERETLPGHIIGTPHYMAPEQMDAGAIGPAADWYAAGAVLYESLTGRIPHEGGSIYEMLARKGTVAPERPRALITSVPEDLDALCMDLLAIDPAARPSGHEVLRRLAVRTLTPALGVPAIRPQAKDPERPPFVGRGAELDAIRAALEESKGRAVTVLVHGESGVGKSALVRRFCEEVAAGALVLSGRCYEREAVPYKALDGIVDALSRHLVHLEPVDAALLLPRDAGLLAQVFPVLRRVGAVTRIQPSLRETPDPWSLRTRAFAALREMLARLAERSPLVLSIDDLQWADADGLALLADLLRPPDAPPLLLLATVRSGARDPDLPQGDVVHVRLERLADGEARELVDLLTHGGDGARVDAEAIAREARGHPLFIQELARAASYSNDGRDAALRLDDVLFSRVMKLEAPARHLLEVIAVAGSPLSRELFAAAAEVDPAVSASLTASLRAANLVRTSSGGGVEAVEPYHDRVRESVTAHLDAAERRRIHGRLASALEADVRAGVELSSPDALLVHLEAAGEKERAAEEAERAAGRAAEALAFDRAAELYALAIALGAHTEERARPLKLARAHALAEAGRLGEAAEAYLAVAEGADPETRLDCRRRAAEYLVGSGELDRGLEAISHVLAETGDRLPRFPVIALVCEAVRLRLRGMRWVRREEETIPRRELVRVDVHDAVAKVLGRVDVRRGAVFAARGFRLALCTGEPRRVAHALLNRAVYHAMRGLKSQARAEELVDEAERILAACDAVDMRPLLTLTGAGLDFFRGAFRSAVEKACEAEERLRVLGRGVLYRRIARFFRLGALMYTGAYRELERFVREGLRECAAQGDRLEAANLTLGGGCVWLAADDPREALRRIEATAFRPPRGTPSWASLQVTLELRARTEILLYTRALPPPELSREIERIPHFQPILARCAGRHLRGRLALLEAAQATDPRHHLALAAGLARWLERARLPYALVWAGLIRAGVAARSKDPARAAELLRETIALSEKHHMLGCAAAARRRLGGITGGPEGRALVAASEQWMANEGINSPARMTDMLAPGFD